MAQINNRPIIKKKKIIQADAHHGGAWKVAYADFVTAMMAFFMLLWLLNVSDKETLEGLADYFSPTSVSESGDSGSGKPLAGTSLSAQGVQASGSVAVKIPAPPPTSTEDSQQVARAAQESGQDRADYENKINEQPSEILQSLTQQIRVTLQESAELSKHQDQLITEQIDEGARIQLIDKDNRPMFKSGSADPYEFTEKLLRVIGEALGQLPNRIELIGHTNRGDADSVGRAAYTNWELSSDRANAARRVLAGSGVANDRFAAAIGKANSEPLYPDAPFRPENRRIAITVLREAPVVPRASDGGF
ncbi:hypothetical protein CCR85_09480 [Rhodothalassium salexigens]|uniref:flagellar motor protein MotB n=1 Tax=Rhodothalassium salexigens TaxID=1086 RepID=UPI001912F73C|nr:flagellar motor protein MotB [Rhodothalassium salexigens]MBK5911716.1 hypothetical protein [Rhodothalassium salexigens]MBK5920497.1 hypothetical protein [Rhodothalassium salexigens]